MEEFKYQAKCGNRYYTDIVQTDTHNGNKVYSATVLHGHSGRTRFRIGYVPAIWIKVKAHNLIFEDKHFVTGVKRVKEIIDQTI